MGCFICQKRYPHECVIEDDMTKLLARIMSTDVIVFATPVFYCNITGQLKVFIDRLFPLVESGFEKIGEDRYACGPVQDFPKLVVVSTCEIPGRECFEPISLFFEKFAEDMGSRVIAELYMNMSRLLTLKREFLAPVIEDYKYLLRLAGREIGRDLRLSNETEAKLKLPLIPIDIFMEYSS